MGSLFNTTSTHPSALDRTTVADEQEQRSQKKYGWEIALKLCEPYPGWLQKVEDDGYKYKYRLQGSARMYPPLHGPVPPF
jgi:hypothetical protein